MKPNESFRSKAVKYVSSAIFILFGLLLIFISVYYNAHSIYHSMSFEIKMHFLSHLGIGFLIIGILVLLFDINQWTAYFKERLTEIVTEKTYLKNFTPEQLSDLQTEVLKVYFNNSDIGGNNGFFQHYQQNIQSILTAPHRTDVELDLVITYTDATKLKYSIHEEIRWTCIGNNGKIQGEISWIPAENEFEAIDIKRVKLKHNSFSTDSDSTKSFEYANFKTEWHQPNGLGFTMPLKEYINLSDLRVTVIVNYVIPKERFIAWRMAHLSKNVLVTVSYPNDLLVRSETYCMNNDYFEINTPKSGYYKWANKGWVLPGEGIAFQIL